MKEYKTIWAILIIIIIIIIFDIILDNNTNKNFDNINEKLSKIDEILDENENLINQSEVQNQAEDMLKTWNEMTQNLSFYIEHDEIEKISDRVNLIKKQIEIEEYKESRQAITEAQFLINHVKEKQQLNLKNIF